jgi:hypothetical protein
MSGRGATAGEQTREALTSGSGNELPIARILSLIRDQPPARRWLVRHHRRPVQGLCLQTCGRHRKGFIDTSSPRAWR